MNDYTVIPLSDVRPGDIAVCNGREFRVEEYDPETKPWKITIGIEYFYSNEDEYFRALGFEFRRPVPREPRRLEIYARVDVHDATEGGPYYSLSFVNMGDALRQFEPGTQFTGTLVEVLEP